VQAKRFRWFGPTSMLPNWQDLRDIGAMFKWFFGVAPRPKFDRWSYWEKFDYWAPFWGMMIIGLSGLMLWFPIATASFLPGWVFNVATIVHAEEAILAAVFLFTVHYFNVHFRPEKWPMDITSWPPAPCRWRSSSTSMPWNTSVSRRAASWRNTSSSRRRERARRARPQDHRLDDHHRSDAGSLGPARLLRDADGPLTLSCVANDRGRLKRDSGKLRVYPAPDACKTSRDWGDLSRPLLNPFPGSS
jgi:hypothetical protein